jgi:transposase
VSKERVIVLSVVQQHLSKAETARRYNISWRWVHTLVSRYQTCGWEAVEAHPEGRTATHARSMMSCAFTFPGILVA